MRWVALAQGDPLTPKAVRDILVKSGIPEGDPAKHIGPLPNLKNAIALIPDAIPNVVCTPAESIITLTSLNNYDVWTAPILGKQYLVRTTAVAKDAMSPSLVVIEGHEYSLPLKQATPVLELPGIEIEVTAIFPNDHLRLAVRSVCGSQDE